MINITSNNNTSYSRFLINGFLVNPFLHVGESLRAKLTEDKKYISLFKVSSANVSIFLCNLPNNNNDKIIIIPV